MTVALIDADVIVYKAAAVSQSNIVWDEGDEPVPALSPGAATQVADQLVAEWAKAAKCKSVLLVFSDRRQQWTFRHGIYHDYKANRPAERPVLHDMVKEYLESKYPNTFLPGLEGDDTMGLMATGEGGGKYVVVSIDKDMKTVPCRQVNPDDKDPVVRKIKAWEADYNWMFQTLTGDPVDNFKGCPMIGKVKAQAALVGAKTLEAMWSRVLETYDRAHSKRSLADKFHVNGDDMGPTELAIMNARCARILRDGDYNRKRNEVRLWWTWIDDTWTSVFKEEGE